MEVLGGPVDFVLHSIGMSPNVRTKRTYDDLDYDMLEKTLDILSLIHIWLPYPEEPTNSNTILHCPISTKKVL